MFVLFHLVKKKSGQPTILAYLRPTTCQLGLIIHVIILNWREWTAGCRRCRVTHTSRPDGCASLPCRHWFWAALHWEQNAAWLNFDSHVLQLATASRPQDLIGYREHTVSSFYYFFSSKHYSMADLISSFAESGTFFFFRPIQYLCVPSLFPSTSHRFIEKDYRIIF